MALKTVINVCEKWLHFFPLILAALIGTALRQPDLLQLPAVRAAPATNLNIYVHRP